MNIRKDAITNLAKDRLSIIGEFKTFAMRGNVIDMAVGIVIGTAFGKIVSSLVSDVVMPPIGAITGGMDFSRLAITLRAASGSDPAVTINYGTFLNSVIDFIIIAFAIFVVIKAMNKVHHKEEVPTEPTTKTCPFCISTIPLKATRCPQCTAEVK